MYAKFAEINLRIYGPQLLTAARGLSMHPASKVAKENLEVFTEMWQWLSGDISTVAKDIMEVAQAITKPDLNEYLSLPRPGVRIYKLYIPHIRSFKFIGKQLIFFLLHRNMVQRQSH